MDLVFRGVVVSMLQGFVFVAGFNYSRCFWCMELVLCMLWLLLLVHAADVFHGVVLLLHRVVVDVHDGVIVCGHGSFGVFVQV